MNESLRLFDLLDHQLNKFPKSNMFGAKEDGTWKTYSTQHVADTIDTLSAGLLNIGLNANDFSVEKQDKVAIISRNRPEWLMLDMACQQIGVILCPIYPTTNPHELEFIFNDASIKYVFISGQEILDKVLLIRNKTPQLLGIYSFDHLNDTPFWRDLLKSDTSDIRIWKNRISPLQCATIIYTSGTTGTPKGVMLSHRNIVSNVINGKETFPFEDNVQAKALSFLPLNHIFERLASYIFIYSGISIYYAENMDTIADNLKEIKPQIFCTVPRLLEKVYDKIMQKASELSPVKKALFTWALTLANKYDNLKDQGPIYNMQLAIANKLVFSKWREALGNNILYIITGGAACQVRLIRIFNAANIPVYEGYGPTENSPVISVNCKGQGRMKFGTVGLVLQGQEVKLEADGEICVKGPSVMMGYYSRPDLTKETIIDGWLYTGDIGMMDDGKFLKITDRKKELFKTSGGKYVAPQPIENKIKESPFIEQAMVVGADQKFVAALIVPSFANLKDWMKKNGIPFTTTADAICEPAVLQLYNSILTSFNDLFNHVEQVKKFGLLADEWTIDSGELTPTLKLKRKVIAEKYKANIEKIYA